MESYEKKYKEALEKARQLCLYPTTKPFISDLKNLFPELAESEDEKIRESLLEYLHTLPNHYSHDGVCAPEWIAWLEKQGENCLVNFDEAEKEKYDFVSGQFIECRKSFNGFKEDNSYWLEYIGDDNYIGRSDNILNQKFHITPRQLFTLFTWQHRPKENNVNEETNVPTGYGKYVDECLNEASKHFFSEGEDKYSVADLFYAGVRCGKSWLEKQGEQKSFDYENANIQQKDFAPKVEPKFKVGDFVINGYGFIMKIVGIEDTCYKYIVIVGSDEERVLDCPFDKMEESCHLWTIEDAKDGDVLCYKDEISLYKHDIKNCTKQETTFGGFVYHCCYDGKRFIMDSLYSLTEQDKMDIHPATKPQRDILFAKMQKAGYEWDNENKELKKIPNILEDCEIEHIEHGKYYYCIKDYYAGGNKRASKGDVVQALNGMHMMALGVKANEYFMPVNTIKQMSSWSGEDENKIDTIISVYHPSPNIVDWLKSLKERYTWKPSNEQMRALHDLNLTGNISYAGQGQILIELYNDLKKLTE